MTAATWLGMAIPAMPLLSALLLTPGAIWRHLNRRKTRHGMVQR